MFNNLDYYIFSSHKTSTQSLIKIFKNNGYKSSHCHVLENIKNMDKNFFDYDYLKLKNYFNDEIDKYNKTTGKKLNMISIIRNPHDRLISSFFQSNYDDQIQFLNKKPEETTVAKLEESDLYSLFVQQINNYNLNGKKESVDELSDILSVNIIDNLIKHDNYYFYSNDKINLYILNFNKLISESNLQYLNSILNINLKENASQNLSEKKYYNKKYINVKKMITSDLLDKITSQYNNFYFTAFVL